jgi:hypothetical protein
MLSTEHQPDGTSRQQSIVAHLSHFEHRWAGHAIKMWRIDPPNSPEKELNMTLVTVSPTVLCDLLDDPPDQGGDDPFVVGHLASNIPNVFVDAHAYARIAQNPGPDPVHFTDDDALPSTSINTNQDFVIDVYWNLSGPLISAFAGSWAVTIFFDCASNADLDLQIQATDPIPYGCPNDGCQPADANARQYHASFSIPANTVKLDPNVPNSTFYELDVSIVLLDNCNSLPTTGITGSVALEEVLIFSV